MIETASIRCAMSGIWIIGALFTAAATSAGAQNATEPASLDTDDAYNLAANWIVDLDPRKRAWASELIASRQFEALYPKLLTALAVSQSGAPGQFDGTPDEVALEVLADAIIRAGLRVPAEDARKLYPEYPALAMILLSRTLDDNRAALISILNQAKAGEVWLAAANLLAAHPAADFIIQQLDDLTVFVRLLVSEPGAGTGVSYGDCFDPESLGASGRRAMPENWPPVAVCRLQTGENGDAVIANGTNSVSFTRQVTAGFGPWKGPKCGGPDIQKLRRDLLVQLSGVDPSTTPLSAVVLKDISIESAGQYQRDGAAILQEQTMSFAGIVSQLQAKGLITPAQAAARRLHMRLLIVRDRSARELPPLPDLRLLGIVGEYRETAF
jgi:hypothetical protein